MYGGHVSALFALFWDQLVQLLDLLFNINYIAAAFNILKYKVKEQKLSICFMNIYVLELSFFSVMLDHAGIHRIKS